MRRCAAAWAVGLAVAVTACTPPRAVGPGAPANTTKPGAKVTSGRLPAVVGLHGRVFMPANLLSDAGGGLLSDAGGGLLSDAGGGLITDNGAGLRRARAAYRTLAAEPRPLANAEVLLADRAGTPIRGLAPVRSDAAGRFVIPGVPEGHAVVLVARFKTGGGATGELRAMAVTQAAAPDAEVDAATTLVTAAVNDGRAGAPAPFDAATYQAAVALVRGRPGDVPAADWTAQAAVGTVARGLLATLPGLAAAVERLRTETARAARTVAELEGELADLATGAGPTPTPAASTPSPAAAMLFTSERFPAGPRPRGIGFLGAGEAWVVCSEDGLVVKLDAASGEQRATISLPTGARPSLPLPRPDGRLWIPRIENNLVSVYSAAGELERSFPAGPGPVLLVPAPDGTVWVPNRGGDTVTRLSADGTILGTVVVGASPTYAVLAPDGRLLVSILGGAIAVVDPAAGAVTATWPVPPQPLAIVVDDASTVWVQHTLGTRLTRLAAKDGAPLGEVDVGQELGFLAADPARRCMWATAPKADRLLRLDPAGKLLGELAVGEGPTGVTLAPDGALWVANTGSGDVSKVVAR